MVVAAAPEPVLTGAQQPRILVVPEGVDHPMWDEVVDFVRALGAKLDEWQWLVLRTALSRSGDLWAAFTVAVCCPRQNGKNEVLELRELIGPALLGESLVIHSAHLADTSRESFRKIGEMIEAHEWLSKDVKPRSTNGFEAFEFKGRGRIRFRTRTISGGRGFRRGSPIMFDEAMIFPEPSMGAILPVASAHPDPQLWYTGSPVDQTTMEHGVVFARVRHRAVTGKHDRLAYFEWSLPYDSPEDVPAEVLADPASWAAVNPAFGVRITPEYVRAELEELGPRMFAVERLGVGDWPSVDPDAKGVIPMRVWNALRDEASKPEDSLVLSFDMTPARSAGSIGAAGRRADQDFHVELVDHRAGTGWMAERIAELTEKHRPIAVVCDSVGPAASLVPDLAALGVKVELMDSGQHARACGQLFDAAHQERLRHRGQPGLDAAVRGAVTRPLGDRWAWARKGHADIGPLVAVTLALGRFADGPPRGMFVAFV